MDDDRFADLPNGLRLCYRVHGDPEAEPLVLLAGLGQQLIAWPEPFVTGLVDRGFRVVRLDNRDAGRSSRVPIPPPGKARQLTRRFRPEQYGLADMAGDTVALLDHLRIDRAHVVGMSMGGMIAQTIAARNPERVRTLTSIFSTTGDKRAGRIALRTMLLMSKPPSSSADVAAERAVALLAHIGSREFALDAEDIRRSVRAAWERGDGATAHEGVARHVGAIYGSGDRTAELRSITAPTLVVHGDRDPLVHPSGGRATAAAIPGARLVEVKGMGHDLGAWPKLLELVADHAGARSPAVR